MIKKILQNYSTSIFSSIFWKHTSVQMREKLTFNGTYEHLSSGSTLPISGHQVTLPPVIISSYQKEQRFREAEVSQSESEHLEE